MFDAGATGFGTSARLAGTETDAALIDLIADLHAREAMLVERKLAAIAEFSLRRSAEHAAAGMWTSTADELAESEIGAALTMGRAAAGKFVGLGISLRTRLHRTRAAMARGELDLYRVGLIDSATANVGDDAIGEVEREVLEHVLAPPVSGGTGLTGRRLTSVIDRIVAKIDPEGQRERRRRALDERFVGVSAVEDGMARIVGSIPAEQARAFDGRLRELAMSVCRHDSRTYEQRRADALGALTSGSTILLCDCGRDECPQDRSGLVVVAKPLVHVIVTDAALRGGDPSDSDSAAEGPAASREPAYLDGYGVISAEHARDIAKNATIRNVELPADVGPDGATAPSRPAPAALVYRPGAALDTWVRSISRSCQWLHCDVPAWNCDLDHAEPFDHADPTRGGKTVAANLAPYCRNHHRLKHSGTWMHELNSDRSVSLTSPTGHRYRTRPTGSAMEAPPPPPASGRRRRTRTENKAARIRAERRRRRTRIQDAIHRRTQRTPHRAESDGDDPPPF